MVTFPDNTFEYCWSSILQAEFFLDSQPAVWKDCWHWS